MLIKTAVPQLLQGCQLIALAYRVFEGDLPDNALPKNSRLLSIKPDGPTSDLELFGILTETETTLRITLRGTDSFDDWVTDSRISLVKALFGQVTAGVDDLAKQLLKQLLTFNLHANKQLIIEGHSLGAAVATHLAYLIYLCHREVSAVYAFASPKFANAQYASAYEAQLGYRTLRIVNAADVVPNVPLDIPGLLYLQHVCPDQTFVDDNGDIRYRHSIDTYQNNIRNWL